MAQVLHVVPVHDLHEHDTDGDTNCVCRPATDLIDGGRLVTHNAFDKRELRERKATR